MPGKLNNKKKKSHSEIDRLTRNRSALFEVMSDIILLVGEDYVIEDMNQSAVDRFGDHRGRHCYEALHQEDAPCDSCPVTMSANGEEQDVWEKEVGDIYVECSYVPFEGYRGDRLTLIVMRDISERKRHEAEIASFHQNIEQLLQQKINELKESESVRRQLSEEVNLLKQEVMRAENAEEMVGNSRRIRELSKMIKQVAPTDVTVLITGESGTGKELVADLIHKYSDRRNKPFLKFNCAAVPETLIESDLFGYEKGSFTGAASCRKGKFEIADGATIFLDEIGDISPKMQATLLRVLQNGEIVRVGGSQSIKVDVRVIAATNSELAKAVAEGRFRRDLYYRLNVINLHQPPLRERKEDILPLVAHFMKKYRAAFKKEIDYLPNKILEKLLMHDWPGNIRELENVIQRAVLLTRGKTISEIDMNIGADAQSSSSDSEYFHIDEKFVEKPLKKSLAEFEKKIIGVALKKCDGKMQDAAEMLGVGKTSFYDKVKRYNLAKK